MTAVAVRTLRVFLCDDTPELRAQVRQAFDQLPDLAVVGEADDPVDGLPLIEQLQPDIVLLDLSMPRMDGLEAIEHVTRLAPDAAIVIFSGFLSTAMAAKALALGADAYLEKSACLDDVADAIRAAADRRAAGERPAAPLEPAPPREPSPPAVVPARAREAEAARLPIDALPVGLVLCGSVLCLAAAVSLSAGLGLDPVVLLVLFLAPVVLVAGRCGPILGLSAAAASGALFGAAGAAVDAPDPGAGAAGTLAAAVALAMATCGARARVLERAEQQAAVTRELQRANSELDQFASVASHDLAAPLRTIAGFTDLLSQRYRGRLDAEADHFIGLIGAGTQRMQETIDDLLAFARAASVVAGETPFPLAESLDGARMNLAASLAERGAIVQAGPLPMVWGDERRIAQVLQNLLANAVKFCPADRTPVIDVNARRVASGWRVEVRDNGIGIDPRHAARVFGMFERLHGEDAYPGTGVGLAICQRIVERHGGRIWIDAPAGGGTLVSFTLPDQDA